MSFEIQHLKFGFYDPFDVYTKLSSDISSKVHLTNLHWKKSQKDNLRSIPQLHASFVEETPKYFDNNAAGPDFKITALPNDEALEKTKRLLEVPSVRLMFIECEDSETYKSKVRPLIKEWLKSAVEGANGPLDWYLVFYHPHSDSHDKNRTRVFEKLKVDFNSPDSDIDRCIRLKEKSANQLEESETWNLFSNKLKTGILYAFTSRLHVLSGAIRDLDLDKESKGTSFFLRLALTEGLSRQFLQLHLFEDALVEYDNLAKIIKPLESDVGNFPLESFDFSNEPTKKLLDFAASPSLFLSQEKTVTLFKLKSYVFSKQFIILESLSQSAPSLSISSVHVSELLRRFHIFVAEILRLFTTNGVIRSDVSEWVYQITQEIFNRDICIKINNFTSEQSDGNITQVSERFGELILVQRTQLMKLGVKYGYYIGNDLSDVSLEDEGEQQYKLQDEDLIRVFESKESFEERYISLTSDAIKHYSISGRPRSVDALSIDIALVDHQNKNYDRAVEVLSTCPDFYASQGWDLISNSLLEIYADCLENLKEDADFFSARESTGEEESVTTNPLSKKTLLCKLYLDIISSYKINPDKHLQGKKLVLKNTFDKLSQITPDEPLVYPVDKLLDIEPVPKLISKDDDSLSVDIKFHNPFKHKIVLQNSRLLLQNHNDEVFKFEHPEITLEGGYSVVRFKSKHIILGEFRFFKFISEFDSITLVQEFEDDGFNILIFTYPENLLLRIENSTSINLTTKSISIFVTTGNQPIKSSKIRLWSKTDGFEPTSGVKAVKLDDDSKIELDENDPENLTLSTGELESCTNYEVVIPYVMNSALNPSVLDLKAQITYETEKEGERSQTVAKILDTTFSIAVSVQDIFKTSGLFAKFSIGTSDIEYPIRILTTKLYDNDKYQVSSAFEAPSLIAFGEQPGSFFYKIQKKPGVNYSSNDSLILDIRYRDLKEELKNLIKRKLELELVDKGLMKYSRLMESILDTLKYDYTHYITHNEIKVIEFKTFNKIVASALDPQDRITMVNLFETLIKTNHNIQSITTEFHDRHLYIDVPIPSVHVIHTVEMALAQQTHYVMGDTIPVKLRLTSFVNGTTPEASAPSGGPSKKKVQFEMESPTIVEFSLEVSSNNDSWLINGKTRFTFNIDKKQSNKSIEFPEVELSIIPLKVGKLAIPKIKIVHTSAHSDQGLDEYLMEVDYKNENETIYVLSEAINN